MDDEREGREREIESRCRDGVFGDSRVSPEVEEYLEEGVEMTGETLGPERGVELVVEEEEICINKSFAVLDLHR